MSSQPSFSKIEQKNRKVRFYAKTLPLIVRILKMIEAGYYPAKIADMLGRSRSGIHYHIKKLAEAGYLEPLESLTPLLRLDTMEPWDKQITKKMKGAIKLYRLTQAGSNFLAGIERKARGRVVRLHNLYVKYPIVRQPSKRIKWRRVEMTNWTQLLGRELGLTVRKNPRSVEVITSVSEGTDPWKMLFQARAEADNLAAHLEQKFDMELGRGELSRKPHFGVYDPVAAQFSKHFLLSDDVGKIDESEGFGEKDYFSPDAAKDQLLLPSNVSALRRDMDDVRASQQMVLDEMKEFRLGVAEHMRLIRELQTTTMEGRELVKAVHELVKELRKKL